MWRDLAIGAAAALAATWLALVVAVLLVRPERSALGAAHPARPADAAASARRDPDLPRAVRVRLALLLAYLALPIDVIPDFIPILGYADDAIIVTATLRGVVRRAGIPAVRRHWPGTADGFAALCRLTGCPGAPRRFPAARPRGVRDGPRRPRSLDGAGSTNDRDRTYSRRAAD